MTKKKIQQVPSETKKPINVEHTNFFLDQVSDLPSTINHFFDESSVYSPRNDPDPEKIPTFLLVDPEMIPKELANGDYTWDCGLLFLFFVEMLQFCHFFSFLRSFK